MARFGDASPDLLYSAPVLLQAFPDARFVQLIRDGRDVAADMLTDPAALSWFKPPMLTDETEFPNPFLGVNSGRHADRWKAMPTAASARCAGAGRSGCRPPSARSSPRAAADPALRGHGRLPGEAVDQLSHFLETRVSKVALYGGNAPKVGVWQNRLRPEDAKLVEKVAREELNRLGYQ
nr:hypothetical protein GCM10020093_028170 [Planobispora longispora]